jgi:hypothetical protein
MFVRCFSTRFLLLALSAAVSAGCGGAASRGRAGEDAAYIRAQLRQPMSAVEREALLRPHELTSVGEMAEFGGLEQESVVGFGLVSGLDGMGGDKSGVDRAILGEVRKILIQQEGRTYKESRDLLDTRDSSIVEVSAKVPAGAAIGQTFDVIVRPLDSAVSLDGGFLHLTPLAPYATFGETSRRGNPVAEAGGPVVAGKTSVASVMGAAGDKRLGIIYEGGKCNQERVLLLRLKNKYISGRRAILIEGLINRCFARTGALPGDSSTRYAEAITNRTVRVAIPSVYKTLPERYADVIRSLRGSYYYGAPSDSEMQQLTTRLERGTPEEKYQASVALEAIGAPAVTFLEETGGDGWTLLYSGQALSYLNSEIGRERVIAAADSDQEEARYEAVRFLAQLAGRSVIQALRAKVFDESDRISIEALDGLAGQPDAGATKLRLADFDIIAAKAVEPRLIIKTGGRPLVAVCGVGTPLVGTIEAVVDDVGLGSTDEENVGIFKGLGPQAQQLVVEATMDNILATFAQFGVSFDTARRVIVSLEDAGNIPYKVIWID